MADILSKIKQAGLVGRGGAGFSVAGKWLAVKNAAGETKYVICNAAEGEPGVLKDGYILEHNAEPAITGIKLAVKYLNADRAFLYLNRDYYKKYGKKLKALIKDSKLEIFLKPIDAGYIGGEESAILNAIEGRRVEPRLKPPYPVSRGLWNQPTLINNLETFYNVGLAAPGKFNNKRFYTIAGDCPFEGVYELANGLSIEKILKQTKNYPGFEFFAQIGGRASGEMLNQSQLRRAASGAGSIEIYSLAKNDYKKAIKNLLNFYAGESCGQCSPCREGVYRLREEFLKEKINWALFKELMDNLREASFCGLGASLYQPLNSFIKNILPLMVDASKL